MKSKAIPTIGLIALALGVPSPAATQTFPTYGCHDVDKAVSKIGTERTAKAFACWVDKVREHELRHPGGLHLDDRLSRAARGILKSGHFGLHSVKRHVRLSGYVHYDPHHPRHWRVARAAPVLLSHGVTPVQIGDDILWHDAQVFAPPFRDIGVAIRANVFLAITAVRGR